MPTYGINSSNSSGIFAIGKSKLWILLVGINKYADESLHNLCYSAGDCEAIAAALDQATQQFLNKEVIIHNDFAPQTPTLKTVRESLERIVAQTQPTDSILLYFSGHGILEPNTQQTILCLADTQKNNLLTTGLALQELLQILANTHTNQQLVCLDTCHSGDMRLSASNRGSSRDGHMTQISRDTTPQLINTLRKTAAQSKGFCALLSCDQGQQSWEFPELGHGVFTYYLVQGLLGEAADIHGVIEADGLYKYIYRKTLQYIDKLNHQLRLINQQKIDRGDNRLYPEYPLQTPKRIVEGVGELILGFKQEIVTIDKQRRALVIDGISHQTTTKDLSRLLAGAGGFQVKYLCNQSKSCSDIKEAIQRFLRWNNELEIKSTTDLALVKSLPTSLLYLRGHIEEIEDGEAWLILGDGVRLSRSWLRQELRRATKTQQIIILDCPHPNSLTSWIEDLQCSLERGQCIIAAASTTETSELFSQSLLATLVNTNPQIGLSASKWIAELQKYLLGKDIKLDTRISETQAIIDILPGNVSTVFQELVDTEASKPQEQQNSSSRNIHLVCDAEPEQLFLDQLNSIANEPVKTTNPPSNLIITEAQSTELEQLLKYFIGPIAGTILKQTLQVNNHEQLIQQLSAYLSPAEQKIFGKQAMVILEKSQIPSFPPLRNVFKNIDSQFLHQCERELVDKIGPMASFIIQQIFKANPQISSLELVQKLSAEITHPQQALEFKRRMLDQG